MSRIAATFARLRAERRTAVVPYLMVGYPEYHSVLDLAPALEAAGADLIELGVPCSNPTADGATIQQASARALQNGITMDSCLHTVKRLRANGLQAPLILMSYYDPLLQYGVAQTCAALEAAGGDGWIVADLPLEEVGELHAQCVMHNLDLIRLVTPATPEQHLAKEARLARGFLYCAAHTGVTGARPELSPELAPFLARVRQQTDLPLLVGFGISTAAHIAQVGSMADGAIVGSALLKHIEGLSHEQLVEGAAAFVCGLRQTHAVTDVSRILPDELRIRHTSTEQTRGWPTLHESLQANNG